MPSWKPDHYNSVSAYLICSDPEGVIRFLQAVFDGEELRRYERPDGSIMHAEVRVDDTVVMLSGGNNDVSAYKAYMHIYVEDAEATYNRAIAYGAQSIQAPERKTPDDDCRGGVLDSSGNSWWMATQ